MKKLAIRIEDLAVDSFETAARSLALRGTVAGHLAAAEPCPSFAPHPCGSDVLTCETCVFTCPEEADRRLVPPY
jgi:hypothetical protein